MWYPHEIGWLSIKPIKCRPLSWFAYKQRQMHLSCYNVLIYYNKGISNMMYFRLYNSKTCRQCIIGPSGTTKFIVLNRQNFEKTQ